MTLSSSLSDPHDNPVWFSLFISFAFGSFSRSVVVVIIAYKIKFLDKNHVSNFSETNNINGLIKLH